MTFKTSWRVKHQTEICWNKLQSGTELQENQPKTNNYSSANQKT